MSLSNKSWWRYNGLVCTLWVGISSTKLPSLLLFFIPPRLTDPLIAMSLNFRGLDVFLWSLHVLYDVPMPDFSSNGLDWVESLNLILKDSVQVSPSRVFQALHFFCRGKGNISESHSVSGPLQINFNLNVWHVSSGKKHFDRSCERTDWEERFSFS